MVGNENLAELIGEQEEATTTQVTEELQSIAVGVISQAEYFEKYNDVIVSQGYQRFENDHLPEGIARDESCSLFTEIIGSKSINHRIPDILKSRSLDLTPVSFDIYKNGVCRIISSTSELLNSEVENPLFYVQSYYIHSNLIYYHCLKVQDGEKSFYVPFEKGQIKKEDVVNLNSIDTEVIVEKLTAPVDIEAVQLLYTPLIKYKDKESLVSNMDTISWMQDLYVNIIDPVHQILINDTILSIINS